MGIILDAVVSPAVSSVTSDRIPVIEDLAVSNDSDNAVNDLRLILRTEPPFCKAKAVNIKEIGANDRVRIKNAGLSPSPEWMNDLKEQTEGVVMISAEIGGKEVARKSYRISILPKDHWPGTDVPVSALSFITPDDPVILRTAANAARLLDAWTGEASMGYASADRSRVIRQTEAVYGAVQQFDIRGTPMQPSMLRGCRISSAERSIDKGSATVLELTFLFLSCAESAGMNTVMIFTKGRTAAGVWTSDTSFKEPVIKDAAAIAKAVRDGSMILVDCEGVTSNKRTDLEASETSAKRTLLNEKEFLFAIDVRCARGDAPAPPKPTVKQKERPKIEKKAVTAGSQALKDAPGAPANELSKRERWENRLLDLSYDNELLNMRITDSLIPIMTNNMTALKDALISGNELTILGKPTEWDNQILNEAPFELSKYMGRHEVLIEQEFRNKHLRSPYGEKDVNKRLGIIHKICKAGEDRGEDHLFVTLGLLKWTDPEGRIIYAPVVMMPAETIKRSVNDIITIKARDDEAFINRTLLEKLKRTRDIEMNNLDPLPAERTGADIEKVFMIVKDAIRAMDGWDIIEGAFIGIFRPERYGMWNDLRGRSDSLFSNKLTKSLMENRLSWQPAPMKDSEFVNVTMVYEADGSQIRAMKAASAGDTFVMNCPPGTGKTRTLANIIASALYNKKTALIVSEKEGTLRSVKRSLDAVGIGKYCLHLDSGNADKKKVIDHFRTIADSASRSHVEDYPFKANEMEKLCGDLSAPARSVHKITSSGKSLYELILHYDKMNDPNIVRIDLPEKLLNSVGPGAADRWMSLVANLISSAKALGHPSRHPLSDVGISVFDDKTVTMIEDALNLWLFTAEDTATAATSVLSSIGWNYGECDVDDLSSLLISLNDIPADILKSGSVSETNEKLHNLIKVIRQSFEVVDNLAKSFDPGVIDDDIELLDEQQDRIRFALDMLDGMTVPYLRTEILKEYLTELAAIRDSMSASVSLLGDVRKEWNDSMISADTKELIRKWEEAGNKKLFSGSAKKNFMNHIMRHMKNPVLQFEDMLGPLSLVTEYRSLIGYIGDRLTDTDALRGGKYSDLVEDCRLLEKTYDDTYKKLDLLNKYGLPDEICEIFVSDPEVNARAKEYFSLTKKLAERRRSVEDILVTDISKSALTDDLKGWRSLCKKWTDNVKEFAKIAEWNRYRRLLENDGLGCVVEAYMNGMPHDSVLPSFSISLYGYLVNMYISYEPALANFDSEKYKERAALFREAMEEFIALSRAEMNTAMATRVADAVSGSGTGAETLRRAILTSGRGMTIRGLLGNLNEIRTVVCPCVITGPASVSQYLAHDLSFDIVIVDDAASMPTHRAVDVITRGKEAILAGDTAQLPAMLRMNGGPADTENVMEECLSVSVPVYDLKWCRNEEGLNEFADQEFYGCSFNTFPSAKKENPKVTVTYVNGRYDRSSGANDAEAEAVVKEVISRLKKKDDTKNSIGVAAFSDAQRDRIEGMLTRELMRYPAHASVMQSRDGLYVKNVNDMQGDERGTMIVSLGIGPDANGRLAADLLPFGKANGEKRLNTALTHSLRETVVFSSLRPADIPDNGTAGVKALKRLLEYAENGLPQKEKEEDELRDTIAKAVNALGYEVHTGIGRSEAAVDIAVVDPGYPDRYILGILLDNGGFARSGAMDSEFVLRKMLTNNGWALHRIWTTDWAADKEEVMGRIVDSIGERLRDRDRWTRRPSARKIFDVNIVTTPTVASSVTRTEGQRSRIPYTKAAVMEKTVSMEALFSNSSHGMIERDIMKVAEAESPVADTVVARRLSRAYGIKNLTAELLEHLRSIVDDMDISTTTMPWGTRILWKDVQGSSSYLEYRVPAEGNERNIRDIADREIINAMISVVTERPGIHSRDLAAGVITLLGGKLSEDAEKIVNVCMDIAIDEKLIKKNSKGNVTPGV